MKFNQLLEAVWERKIRFVTVFFLCFMLSYIVLYVIDFLPETPSTNATELQEPLTEAEREAMSDESDRLQSVSERELNIEIIEETTEATSASASAPVLPTAIYIEKLEKTIDVLNPQSRMIADLDSALLNGVVRHPDSATLNQEGTVFILGHSSYLPNVMNSNFQAFNGIQNLEWGDTIEVTGGDKVFVYRVEKVYRAKASEVTVPIAGAEHLLTIATCNSFGSTDDRYIVEASLLKTNQV